MQRYLYLPLQVLLLHLLLLLLLPPAQQKPSSYQDAAETLHPSYCCSCACCTWLSPVLQLLRGC
jgi:hypothetical protein